MKTKTIITAALMGIGLALLEMKVQQPSGVLLLITGAMFASWVLVQDDSCRCADGRYLSYRRRCGGHGSGFAWSDCSHYPGYVFADGEMTWQI